MVIKVEGEEAVKDSSPHMGQSNMTHTEDLDSDQATTQGTDQAGQQGSPRREANNNSLPTSPAKKPTMLQLSPDDGRDVPAATDRKSGNVTPTRTSSALQPGVSVKKSPTSPEPGTDEYIAHLTYKTHKHNLSENGRLSPHSPTLDPDSPNSAKANKVFNPFPSQVLSRRRAQNGIKLGLYSPDSVLDMKADKPAMKNIGRQQINSCLHRQYMAEMKQASRGTASKR